MRSEIDQIQRPGRSARRKPVTTLATLTMTMGALFLGACASDPSGISNGGKIDVKYYHINPLQKVETTDAMIAFEREHYMHGAINAHEMESRFGNYFTILWKVDDRTGPVKVRFEYRHAKTGTVTDVMETEVVDLKKSNRTVFKVVGEPYFEKGKVIAFKVSLVRNGDILATSESFMWEE